MNKRLKEKMKGVFVIPAGLAAVLVPFSMFVGWNLATLLLFWLVITPALAIYLPVKVSNSKNHLLESLAGLMLFYGFMVFMIYDHYMTDFFQILIISCGINLIIIAGINLFREQSLSNHKTSL